jgi:hypothetical protein
MKLREEQDIEVLRRMAFQLETCVDGNGYCVVDDSQPERILFEGERCCCVAFVNGYNTCPGNDASVFDDSMLCVCLNTPTRSVVIPEDRFGEWLIKSDSIY